MPHLKGLIVVDSAGCASNICAILFSAGNRAPHIVSQGCLERRDQGVGRRTAWLPHRRPERRAPLVALGRKAFAPTARAARRVDLQSPAVVGWMEAQDQVKTERCRDTWSMMLLMLS